MKFLKDYLWLKRWFFLPGHRISYLDLRGVKADGSRHMILHLISGNDIRCALESGIERDEAVHLLTKVLTRVSFSDTHKLVLQMLDAEASQLLIMPGHPAARLLDLILHQAFWHRASDVQLSPMQGAYCVDFRIDGTLQRVLKLEMPVGRSVVSKLKVDSSLMVHRNDIVQEGRMTLAERDIRVSVLPTIEGERASLRIFPHAGSLPSLAALGFDDELLEQLRVILSQPDGMILVTGAAGSGKTTTVYSMVKWMLEQSPGGINIMSVEDPVECRIPGVYQVQVQPENQLSFEEGLKALLRQDPQVLLVGEIRDAETAKIATRAAMTGDRLIATLHGDEPASAAVRMMELGVAPGLVAATLRGVLCQRLVRERCTCEGGCDECQNSGSRGRFAVGELLMNTSEVRQVLGEGGSVENIRLAANRIGVKTLGEKLEALVARGRISREDSRHAGRNRGVTLIELMISIALLGIVVALSGSLYVTQYLGMEARARHLELATSIGEAEFSRLQSVPYSALSAGNLPPSKEAQEQLEHLPDGSMRTTVTARDAGLSTITLELSWLENQQRSTIKLSTMRGE